MVTGKMIRYCVYPLLLVFLLHGGGGVPASGPGPGGTRQMQAYAAVCSAADRNAVKDAGHRHSEDSGEESRLCSFKYIIYFFWYACCAVLFAVVFVMDVSTGCSQHYTKDFYGWFQEHTHSLDRFFQRAGCG